MADTTDIILPGKARESNYEYDKPLSRGVNGSVPSVFYKFEDNKYQYNQQKDDPDGCCWYAVLTAVSNNWGIVWTDADFASFRVRAPSYGWTEEDGMELSKAGDMVVDYLNEKYPTQHWKKTAIDLYDQGEDYMNNGYVVMIGSFINKTYISFFYTGLINKYWGKDGTGHARCMFHHQAYDALAEIENYFGFFPHNILDIDGKDLWEEFKTKRQYYGQAFIYYPSGKMPTQIPSNIKYWTEAEASQYENEQPGLLEGLTETVRTWLLYAGQGMKLGFTNYRGLSGVGKMELDIDKYRDN